ncbi:MAG: flavocytochrome c [Eggerthellaceae bacterium]|jgi:fumarate reductase flavoprotein subunit|nr:flavocytochrome c [Eggerthellaceae bacterium]
MEELNDEQTTTIADIYGDASKHGVSRRGFVAGVGALGALGVMGAGLSGCASPSKSSSGSSKSESHDVVVVGMGGAGMSAAITAFDAGINDVVILEKMSVVGGNTNFSSSGMNASETKFQKAQGIEDSNDLFAKETYEGGHDTGNLELIHFMCDNSAAAIDWLDGLGVTLDNISTTGGMSVKRCHRPHDGSAVGLTLVPGLESAVNNRNITVMMNAEVTELMTDDSGAVTGVKATINGKDTTVNAKAVILATGGLGSNKDLISKYRPDLKDYISTNQPGATGDGYVMAENAGAELIQMDQIQIHPTVEQTTATLIAEGIRGTGAILVNTDGKRFYDEMSTRDKVSAAELAQPNSFSWEIFDQQVYDKNTAIKTYEKKGLVTSADSTAELASKIGVDPATLQETIASYNEDTTAGKADEFGRTSGMIAFNEGKMYAIKVAPGIHHEMGGIKIDTKNQALNSSDQPVKNLYAAGEVTGGIHGNNRIGGNAVCDITVFGRNVGSVVSDVVK